VQKQVEALLSSMMLDCAALSAAATPVPGRRARRMIARLDAIALGESHDDDAGLAALIRGQSQDLAVRGSRFAKRWAHIAVFNRRHALVNV
jgi:hypothetical protein